MGFSPPALLENLRMWNSFVLLSPCCWLFFPRNSWSTRESSLFLLHCSFSLDYVIPLFPLEVQILCLFSHKSLITVCLSPSPRPIYLLFIPLGLPKTWPLPGSGSHSFPSFIREGTAGLLSSQKSPLGPKLAPRLLAHFLDPRHHLSPCSHWATRHLNFFVFLGLHPQHMKVPRLGVQSELEPPVYATVPATSGPSCV